MSTATLSRPAGLFWVLAIAGGGGKAVAPSGVPEGATPRVRTG
jgi:hypothetical protein